MKAPEKLEDLSKEQLILLLTRGKFYCPTPREMAYAVWLDMNNRANKIGAASLEKMQANTPTGCDPVRRRAFMQAVKESERSQTLYHQAAIFYNTYLIRGQEPVGSNQATKEE